MDDVGLCGAALKVPPKPPVGPVVAGTGGRCGTACGRPWGRGPCSWVGLSCVGYPVCPFD